MSAYCKKEGNSWTGLLGENVLVDGKCEILFLLLRVVVAHGSVGGIFLEVRATAKGLWIALF